MNDWPISLSNLAFIATFLGMALWESLHPARAQVSPLGLRWSGNIILLMLASLIARLLPFLSGYGAAEWAASRGWGLLHHVPLTPTAALAASIILLDFFGYWTHRLMHQTPLLWRLHALHHSDSDLDVTTTFRHHPAEALVQGAIDAALALLFGISPQAVAIYGAVVLMIQTVHHGNVMLPARLRPLSRIVITPDLHRLHHSMRYAENNSNFGNAVPLWDWLFGTLRRQPEGELEIGLPEFPGAAHQRLGKLLLQPLLVVIASRKD